MSFLKELKYAWEITFSSLSIQLYTPIHPTPPINPPTTTTPTNVYYYPMSLFTRLARRLFHLNRPQARPRKLIRGRCPVMTRRLPLNPPAQELWQNEGENPQLLPSGHAPSLPVHPDCPNPARLQQLSVLLLGPVIRVNPHRPIASAPIDNLRVGNTLAPESSPHALYLISNQAQGLGDGGNQGFIQEKSDAMRIGCGLPSHAPLALRPSKFRMLSPPIPPSRPPQSSRIRRAWVCAFP